MMESITLYELNRQVRRTLEVQMPSEVWVQAEVSEVHPNPASGHCFVELVQKDEKRGTPIAKARGTIWANVWAMLAPHFEEQTGQPFKAGIKVLLLVSVSFHEQYGYSLVIKDIDPVYTLGEMERNRREILRRLQEEGVADMNKELPWPLLPQRVAVISSATAAGYGDFCNQLLGNSYGFVFYVHLFQAVMQGEQVEESVIAALDRIAAHRELWDVVVIIRGGGSTSDLSGFDTYPLAVNCAQFPLPLVTGIGHERDDTLIDTVAHTRVKTPTAAAALLIDSVAAQAAVVNDLADRTVQAVVNRLQAEKHRIAMAATQLPTLAALLLQKKLHRIELWEQTVKSASPEVILKRGYSLTLKSGKVVTDAAQLKEGDDIETRFACGSVTSIVKTNL